MSTGAIIQARTSSTRLPRKVLKELPYGSGITVLQQVIRRVRRSAGIDKVIIATTTDPDDDKIVTIAQKEGVPCFRGSKENVLERYFLAAREHQLDTIVRVTSDCPCVDASIIDSIISQHFDSGADYSSNVLVRSFPYGVDTEVLSFAALEAAHKGATRDYEREHVCPFIYKSHPEKFKILSVVAPQELHRPDIRVTLDTEEDYALLCVVYEYIYPTRNLFDLEDVVQLYQEKPWLAIINGKVAQKKMYDSLEEELKDALRMLDLWDLKGASAYFAQGLQGVGV
ncbi:MAG: 3-deoxy-manno-octulosonate cytidylyltransferase [Syntrophorhabdus sp. PtaU1.Bin153]|nr:MAG: 3-deoxy-manno-octulosonate cytidylyltransferase [Syntrophorhabdus sp. PtaU1.Bin153]